MNRFYTTCIAGIGALGALTMVACRPRNMAEQPRYEYLESSDSFADSMVARQPVSGTVAREGTLPSSLLASGQTETGTLAVDPPMAITYEMLERGRERFGIYCAVCHGNDGYGSGIVVRRGFPPPPSFHNDRLRNAPIGYFVHVIQNGYGVMYRYGDRVLPEDRWAIAAFVRALQLSQYADSTTLPLEDQQELKEAGQ